MLDEKRTLKEQTREYILNLIRERNLCPGDRLPAQREIAQVLKVSPKIPEIVLSELEAEHKVTRKTGRGTFLAEGIASFSSPVSGGRNVFLLLPTLRNPHFVEYAANAEVALLKGKKTMHIITREAMPQTRDVISKMIQEGTSGIIALDNPKGLRTFALRHRIPWVEIRYQSPGVRCPARGNFVIADLRSAAQIMGDHLLELGHKDIYLAGDLPRISASRMDFRFLFLKQMLESHGCRVRYLPQRYPIEHYSSYEAIGAELAQSMIDEGLPATAAIFFNAPRAVGAMRFLLQKGIRVPEDFSILGFGKPFQSGFPEPVISAAIHYKVIEMAVSLLLAGNDASRIIRIDPVFEKGSSTGPARTWKVFS